ncbi:MAG: hypothetical protein GY932_03500, partial [Arcobacter sp.]|nr:hypothetical protein [Arcobacter sp.]
MLKNNFIIIFIINILLIGCGGSGSNSKKDVVNQNISYSGRVIDGYIKDAQVFLDLNLNGSFDEGEPEGNSNDVGEYEIEVTIEKQKHTNYDIAPIIAIGGIDIDTGKAFEGKLEARKDETGTYLTPITTLVSKMVAKEAAAGKSKEEIAEIITQKKQSVAKVLGLKNVDEINENFIKNENKKLNKIALQIQKTVELLSQALNDGNVANEEILDTVLKTFGDKIEELKDESDDKKLNVENLVEKTLEEASKDGSDLRKFGLLLKDNHIQNIKTISENIGVVFDNMKQNNGESYETLHKKSIVLIEKDLLTFKNSIEENKIVSINKIDKSDERFIKTKEELRVLGIKNELTFLNLSNPSLIADKLSKIEDPKIHLYNLYEVITDEFIENNKEFKELKLKIDRYKSNIKEKKKKEKILESKVGGLALTTNETFNVFYGDRVLLKINLDINSKTIDFLTYEFNIELEDWLRDIETLEEYFLTEKGWKLINTFDEHDEFIINNDNTLSVKDFNYKLSVVAKNDLSNKKYFIKQINESTILPDASTEYLLKLEKNQDNYYLFKSKFLGKASESISSFSSLINEYCGDKIIQYNVYSRGLSFAGNLKEDGSYSCD